MRIELNLHPREPFKAYLLRSQRFACLVCHRRAGKTFATLQDLIAKALTNPRTEPPPRYGYIAPTRDQAKDIAWGYLQRFVAQIPGVESNQAELSLILPTGAQIRLYSGDSFERMRGLHFDGVVIDEPADITAEAWTAVIRPCLADFEGWATFIGTPKGRDAFHERWIEATSKPDEWFSLLLKASSSGLIGPKELASLKASMSVHSFQQEFECDFDAPIPGAIYADEIVTARVQNRIAAMPWDRSCLVHTSWDLGSPENMGVWYWQVVGRSIRIIDFDHGVAWAENGEDALTARVGHMKAKGYPFGYHYLPHDAESRPGTGLSFLTELARAGLPNLRVVQRTLDVWLGINVLKELFPLLEFRTPECDRGLQALSYYHRRPVSGLVAVKDEPVHDWSSHAADSLRIMAEAWKVGYFKFSFGPNLDPANKPPKESWQRAHRRGMREISVGG